MTGSMAREFFGASPLLALPILALLIFAVVFVLLAVRTLRLRQSEVDQRARIALDEGGNHG